MCVDPTHRSSHGEDPVASGFFQSRNPSTRDIRPHSLTAGGLAPLRCTKLLHGHIDLSSPVHAQNESTPNLQKSQATTKHHLITIPKSRIKILTRADKHTIKNQRNLEIENRSHHLSVLTLLPRCQNATTSKLVTPTGHRAAPPSPWTHITSKIQPGIEMATPPARAAPTNDDDDDFLVAPIHPPPPLLSSSSRTKTTESHEKNQGGKAAFLPPTRSLLLLSRRTLESPLEHTKNKQHLSRTKKKKIPQIPIR